MHIDLTEWGLTDSLRARASESGRFLGRVVVEQRGQYRVVTARTEAAAELSGRMLFESSETGEFPAVGDWVLLDREDDEGGNALITALLPRTSAFERKAAGTATKKDPDAAISRRQIVAANIDTVFLCMAAGGDFNLRRLERYLAVAWDSGAVPVVVLTKADLSADAPALRAEAQRIALGADVVLTSAVGEEGVRALSPYLHKGKTVAFVGASGAGKSTLINALLGENRMETGAVRADERGRHTTTHRELLLLPAGGIVIDTPGMRELGMASADLERSFADIEELSQECRFADCAHQNEPQCAVRRAVEEGRLSPERLANYHKLKKELLYEDRKASMTSSRADKLKIIGMMGSLDAAKQILKNNPKYNNKP